MPPTAPLPAALDDPERAHDLARMKRLATGLFGLAAAVFLACVLLGSDAGAWVGYVRATAEASMVGALGIVERTRERGDRSGLRHPYQRRDPAGGPDRPPS